MSEKNRDKRQRWRCHTVAVRLSPEESKLLDMENKLLVIEEVKEMLLKILD